jgi:glycosidase
LLVALSEAGLASSDAVVDRPPQDDVVYFLLPDRFANGDPANDRGGLEGDRLRTGFDPLAKGFYHGGDLAGVTAHLDYIQSLGATALWLAPVFRNKPVQGPKGRESAGYHGYWVTDFTRVDPHFGDERTMHALVDAAHSRGMKVYLDIIANHTADVISYRECPTRACPYRSRAEYPDKAYTPVVTPGEEHIKVPDWLNDPAYYHNRGDSTFAGESSEAGDFAGLDDLNTEDPRVVQGFIDIFGGWIADYGVDGFRIDTARHVNPEFWQAFVPAMRARAAARGITNFYIFGEVATTDVDVAQLARWTRVAKLPAVLDFAFAYAVRATVAGNAGTDVLARVFMDDALYEGGAQAALALPTFISNHDMGRFAWFVRADRPTVSEEEAAKRVMLAHAMLMTLRGVPVIYYGDEQGFVGSGGDQDARQDMFSTFDRAHPLYRAVAELAALRKQHAAFRGGRQIVRNYSERPGLFAVSRIDPVSQRETIIAFNTAPQELRTFVEVERESRRFKALHGYCAPKPAAPGSYPVTLPPLDYIVCAAGDSE